MTLSFWSECHSEILHRFIRPVAVKSRFGFDFYTRFHSFMTVVKFNEFHSAQLHKPTYAGPLTTIVAHKDIGDSHICTKPCVRLTSKHGNPHLILNALPSEYKIRAQIVRRFFYVKKCVLWTETYGKLEGADTSSFPDYWKLIKHHNSILRSFGL